jgi:hypothetical protein
MTFRDEEFYRAKLHASGVPEYMHDGYILYLLHGIPPGDFLLAVLTNNLRDACGRADNDNARALSRHVYFLYNYAPGNAWGSVDDVTRWLTLCRERDSAAVAEAGQDATD